MSDRTQDITNHRKVAVACKNYTDTQIAQAKEEIYWHIGEYSVTTSDDNTSASVKTVPANATRCKIKRVYGNTQKLNPTTASDSTSAMIKTMPSTVYDFDVSKVEGASYKINQLVLDTFHNYNYSLNQWASEYLTDDNLIENHKYLLTYSVSEYTSGTLRICFGGLSDQPNSFTKSISSTGKQTNIFTSSSAISGYRVALFNYGSTVASGKLDYVMIFDLTDMGIDTTDVATATTELLKRGIDINEYQAYNTGSIRNFAWNGIVIKDSNDDTQQTIPIDLSTILYNGSPLFEENALKGVGTAKDYITPYKACKVMGSYTFTGNESFVTIETNTEGWTQFAFTPSPLAKESNDDIILTTVAKSVNKAGYDAVASNLTEPVVYHYGTGYRFVLNTITVDGAKAILTGKTFIYELATPIEVSINWASTLRGITGYSNGTITLLNTNNMDSANTITYNSIIKENCCAKMVQSRNGSVIKTINFPTQASDGYSAGSVANARDFTNNTRTPYVNKVDLGTLSYERILMQDDRYRFTAQVSNINTSDNFINLLCYKYKTIISSSLFVDMTDKSIKRSTSEANINIIDVSYSDATVFKNAMSGTYLYYEKATSTSTAITPIENVIVVQAGDELAFYDSDDNLVTVPSDLTYRIEVAN